jgi:hypothetical protein
MLAGGMTIAAPSMMVPEAAAAGALYVSAENALFDNTFGGVQVVEVVVIDKQNETDEEQGEPVVKINEIQLRMAQAVDGNWYGYFGDKTSHEALEPAQTGNLAVVHGINFGYDITPDLAKGSFAAPNVLSKAADVLTGNGDTTTSGTGTINNAPTLSAWNSTNADNSAFNADVGQIGLAAASWPVIQLYDLTIETFEVRYEQAGADEVVVLNYDTDDIDDYASMTLDRNSASQDSEVHLTITDNQLNLDPTGKDVVLFYVATGLEGVGFANKTGTVDADKYIAFTEGGFDDNGKLIITNNTNGGSSILSNDTTIDDDVADNIIVFYETAENSGVFVNTDDDDDSNINIDKNAARGFSATFDYNDSAQSLVVANSFATIDMVASSVGDEWNSGEALTVILIDEDQNKNTYSGQDLTINNSTTHHIIPTLTFGNPVSIDQGSDHNITANATGYSKIGYYTNSSIAVDVGSTDAYKVALNFTQDDIDAIDTDNTYFNYDVSSFANATNPITNVQLIDAGGNVIVSVANEERSIVELTSVSTIAEGELKLAIYTTLDTGSTVTGDVEAIGIVADVMSWSNTTNNSIYRLLLEEDADNSATFVGTIEFTMLNQINVDLDATYTNLATVDQDIDIIVTEDLTDEDSPRVNYNATGADGVYTAIADQMEAPTHNGVVSFDLDNYKIGDTVVVTLDDQDMNADSELIDIYTTNTRDMVGASTATDLQSGLVLNITYDDLLWVSTNDSTCSATGSVTGDDGLEATGFTLVETDTSSGIFVGSFQVPTNYCNTSSDEIVSVTGKDIEVNYQDYRNSSGESTEVGDGASINANTGSVTFDRTVYPVPYDADDFDIHATANDSTSSLELDAGSVVVHVRVTDADYNVSAQGEDSISDANVTVKVVRGSASTVVGVWGNSTSALNDSNSQTGKITEVSPDSGVFEADITIANTAGPTTGCPTSSGCILQGDIITVEYADNNDASGKAQTVTDSATFDLRNGVLQSDKSVYLIGSDMILTLIEPDFDLDNDGAQSVPLTLIEWDSDAKTTSLAGMVSGTIDADDAAAFDPEPSELRETGDSTGIFQVVIEIPETLGGDKLDRGEKIDLEYTDWGPAGADYVGQEDEDIGLTIYTSNFGATIELDQKVYSWTDKVYITIVEPDHNFDSG